VYVSLADAPVRSAADAAYFVTWVDRLISAAGNNTSWNTAAGKGIGARDAEKRRRLKYARMVE